MTARNFYSGWKLAGQNGPGLSLEVSNQTKAAGTLFSFFHNLSLNNNLVVDPQVTREEGLYYSIYRVGEKRKKGKSRLEGCRKGECWERCRVRRDGRERVSGGGKGFNGNRYGHATRAQFYTR